MKFRFPLLVVLFIFLTSSHAQINIGSAQMPNSRSGSGEIKPQNIKKLKRTTLVIYYGDSQKEKLQDYEKALAAWTFSPIKLDHISNKDSYNKKRGFVFATLETEPVVKVNPNLGTKTEVDCQIYLHFWSLKGKEQNTFARLDLFVTHDVKKQLLKLKTPEEKVDYMYANGKAYNWGPGFMKLYLAHMSKKLSAGELEPLMEDYENEEALAALKDQVLFYPECVLTTKDVNKGTLETQLEEELFEDYPYEHVMMLDEDMDNFLFDESDGQDMVLIYTQSGDVKHYCVYTTDGSLLFHEVEIRSYNLDDGDLKKIAKVLK